MKSATVRKANLAAGTLACLPEKPFISAPAKPCAGGGGGGSISTCARRLENEAENGAFVSLALGVWGAWGGAATRLPFLPPLQGGPG